MSAPASITVLRPGALTTVQDLGRPGHAASGVPRGGAFDPWAARAANRLVGNSDGAALLEITLAGPTLELDGVAAVAIVGDPFELEIESGGAPVRIDGASAESFLLKETARVSIGRARGGVRAWLAVAGGLDVPLILGSCATDLAGGFGGLGGRPFRAGDRLAVFPSKEDAPPARRRERVHAESEATRLRLLAGPDQSLLVKADASELLEGEWALDPRSDRRGVRLGGRRVETRPHEPLRSQGVLPGAVQIPPSGEPIVLGVDAPVTGGYPWVAQVIEADVGRLAHLAPGAKVRFERVDPEAAAAALAERWHELEEDVRGS